MSETGYAPANTSQHPKMGMCKELLELFCKHNIGTLGRFAREGGGFRIEPVSPGALSNWSQSHDGGFRHLSKDMSRWGNDDFDILFRQVQGREFYFEVESDNILIFKNKDC